MKDENQERTAKIAAVQKLIDEAEESGISALSMDEIRAEAIRRIKAKAQI